MIALEIENTNNFRLDAAFSVRGQVSTIIEYDNPSLILEPENFSQWDFNIIGESVGLYTGAIVISGDVQEEIPVNVTITGDSLDPLFLVDLSLLEKVFTINGKVEFKVDLNPA